MKLNIGSGSDYREGFINIDGSSFVKVDRTIDISKESLLSYFKESEVEYILANDIIEHHFRWEAIRILNEFYMILSIGGVCEIRVPDADFIMKNWRLSAEKKITLLFGGQDIPQGLNADMEESRKVNPHFFCHKYGWTRKTMKNELYSIGFSKVTTKRLKTNIVVYAVK